MSHQVSSPEDRSTQTLSLDEIIEAFETAWSVVGHAEVAEFLPSSAHPDFENIVAELLCVDLERRWKCGIRKTVEDYRSQFPVLTASKNVLERLTFEEYRLASTADASVSPDDYGRRYEVRTDHWPRRNGRLEQTDAVAREALSEGVADEMERITAVTQPLPEVGERFLNFEIVEQLGQCKFGSVFLASQGDLANRLVVIKVTTNLWSEADRLARLQHTNIVPIYSVHQHDGLQAVCMPYLGRHTLETLVEIRSKRTELSGAAMIALLRVLDNSNAAASDTANLPERHLDYLKSLTYEQLCAWVGARIAAGLSHAHERGILHRDLKPANILLTGDMQPMILDFNLSEDVVAGGRTSLLIGGTLPFMAPEQLRAVISHGDVDRRSDIYSLGVILFQMLTGQLPFPEMPGSIIGSLSYRMNDPCNPVPSPRDVSPYISKDMESIVKRCLTAEPDDRYQSAHELREDLEAHLHHSPLKHAPNRSTRLRLQKWFQRHPRMGSSTAVLAVCSIVLAAMAGVLILRGAQLAQLEAIEKYQQFDDRSQAAFAPLSAAITDSEIIHNGLNEAEAALAMYSADRPDWPQQPGFRHLDEQRQAALAQTIQTLQFLRAGAVCRQASQAFDSEQRRVLFKLALRFNQSARAAGARNRQVSPAVLLQHADLVAELGHADKAAGLRQTAEKLPAGDTTSRLMLAVQYIRMRDYQSAEPILTKLRVDLARDYFVWFLLGNCNYGLGRLAEADTCFTSCIALRPEIHISYFQRGVCRMKARRFAAAERDFSVVLQLRPTDTSALANRALVRIEQQEFQTAADDLTRAIGHGKRDSLMFLLRACVWKALGKLEEAQRDLDAGESMTPVCVEGWIQRALAFRRADPMAALRDLDAALASNPTSRKALQNKASILSQLHRDGEGIETLSALIAAHPQDATALFGRGLLRARRGERDAAVADGLRGFGLNDSPRQHYQLARIFAQTSQQQPEDVSLATNHLRKALQGDSKLVEMTRRDPDLKPILYHPEVNLLLSAALSLQAVELTDE